MGGGRRARRCACRLLRCVLHLQSPANALSAPNPPSPPCSLWQRLAGLFEPSVHSTTLVNDGSVFVLLGIWAAWQATTTDPTLPLGACLAYAVWKIYDKRVKRSPGACRPAAVGVGARHRAVPQHSPRQTHSSCGRDSKGSGWHGSRPARSRWRAPEPPS